MRDLCSAHRRLILWAGLCAVATALVFVACAGADIAPATPDETEARDQRQDYEDAEDEGESAWRWQGRRQDCFFVYENECFSDLEEACEAAGCSNQVCTHDDSAPANVACPEE